MIDINSDPNQIYEAGYDDGLRDAWDAARELHRIGDGDELFKAVGWYHVATAINARTAREIIDQLVGYRESNAQDPRTVKIMAELNRITKAVGCTKLELADILLKDIRREE